jgi:5-methylcytosine-specific restriction endonuclease McrA
VSSHLEFLRNLQKLLDEGVFVATYKHALLQSLADLSIERQPDQDGSITLPVPDIAEKFIQYYWPQTAPYRGPEGVLHQNTGKQAAIVNYVAETRADYDGSLVALQGNKRDWNALRRRVAHVIRTMPLWKLQVVAGIANEFIYRHSEYSCGAIRVLPDAVQSFRDLYVIITNFVRGAWIAQIQSISFNRNVLGDDAGLPQFLFGTERRSLERYKAILQEFQASRCFYCGSIAKSGDLDHFIPWSRYPVDLGHNFVFAHARCNRDKRDFLADLKHLSKWKETNLEEAGELTKALTDAGLVQDKSRSRHVAIWAYEQGEAVGSHIWSAGNDLKNLGSEWRRILLNNNIDQPILESVQHSVD